MTDLTELLTDINHNLYRLTDLDWCEETDWFNKDRIKQILMGIENDKVFNIVGEYIAIAWYEACDGGGYTNKKLMEPTWEGYEDLRFCQTEDKAQAPGSIESYISKIKAQRGRSLIRKEKKERLRSRVMQMEFDYTPSSNEEAEAYIKQLPYEMCEALMITIKNRNTEITQLRTELDKLTNEYANKVNEWETYKTTKEDIIKQASVDANRKLIEQLIIYAEGEQKNVAREIKIALTTKMANGYIAGDTLSEEWKQRLENLGRENPRNEAMNFNNTVGTVVAHADNVTLQYQGQ